MSGKQESDLARFERQMDELKGLYGVREDKELAEALGSTKTAVANWRRRHELPAWVLLRATSDFPLAQITGEASANSWYSLTDVYAVALAIFDDYLPPQWADADEHGPDNLALRGHIFADLVDVLHRHISTLPVGGPNRAVVIIERCLADYHAGAIEGLDQALMRNLRR